MCFLLTSRPVCVCVSDWRLQSGAVSAARRLWRRFHQRHSTTSWPCSPVWRRPGTKGTRGMWPSLFISPRYVAFINPRYEVFIGELGRQLLVCQCVNCTDTFVEIILLFSVWCCYIVHYTAVHFIVVSAWDSYSAGITGYLIASRSLFSTTSLPPPTGASQHLVTGSVKSNLCILH